MYLYYTLNLEIDICSSLLINSFCFSANSNPNIVAVFDGDRVLRRLLLGILFDGGFLLGLKNLIDVTIATHNQKLKYMLILCVPICLIYYFVRSTHPKEAKPHIIK
jgi:hypothetical protein